MKIKAQIDRFIGKDNRVKAYASVILGGEYVIRDIAVMDSKNGLFARMPYRSWRLHMEEDESQDFEEQEENETPVFEQRM